MMFKNILFFFFLPIYLLANRIEIVPDWPISEQDEVVSKLKNALAESGRTVVLSSLAPYIPFLQKDDKRAFTLPKEVSRVVFWNVGQKFKKLNLSRMPKEKLILFMWEPPTVQKHLYTKKVQEQFAKVYTWDDDLVDNVRVFKFFYPVLHPMIDNRPAFEEKKLCTLINSNRHSKHPQELYSARKQVIDFFEEKKSGDFEFYGWGWEKEKFSTYRGSPQDKIDAMKSYRFCICYENIEGKKGYITEKIFDAFSAGCVPVYWGASNVEQYIPSNCYIDRRKFKDHEELYAYLKNMKKAEYEQYIVNISTWLSSKQAALFSQENFVKIFAEAVR
ncbi:MAG: glycosyltransferase family 10 domain-containing protein [Chlamydiales bacterium]